MCAVEHSFYVLVDVVFCAASSESDRSMRGLLDSKCNIRTRDVGIRISSLMRRKNYLVLRSTRTAYAGPKSPG